MPGDGKSRDPQVRLNLLFFSYFPRFEPSYDMPDVMYYQVNEIFHTHLTLTSLRAFLKNSLVGKCT